MTSADPRAGLPVLEREVDARSERRLVEANGERAALLGDEHGVFECWIWPIKVCRDLALTVRAGASAFHARACARRVRVTPCDVEIEYARDGWRVVLRAFAARDRRALVLTFEVETAEPLTLDLAFTPEVKPMWPAGLGGQIAFVDPETGALALTEELGRFAALIGSPDAAPLAVSADHALPREPVALSIAVDPARAKQGPLTAFIAGAEIEKPPLSDAAKVGLEDAALGHARAHRVLSLARDEYRWIAREWREALRASADHWRDFLARTTHFESDDVRHTQAFLWAKIAIERAWVTVDGVGRGLVAGLAVSGAGERPGFGWFFDGDAMIAARAMCMYGDFAGAREVLEFAASHQRADGKMMHELTLSARWCDWLGDYPYAYYKANNTPEFISTLADYFAWSGDRDLVDRLWPNVRRAYEFCESCIDDDGLLSAVKAGMAAVEAGSLVGKIRADIFLQGLWIGALRSLARLAKLRGDESLAAQVNDRLSRARGGFEAFWSHEHGRYGFAQLVDGSRSDDLTAYQAHPASEFVGEEEHVYATAAVFNAPALACDWGVRFFATDSNVYDPANYNTGAVFPYATNFSVSACFHCGLTDAGHQLLASQIELDGFSGLGFVPEHLRGDRCEAPPRGVPHQIFSSAAIVEGIARGMLGVRAVRGSRGWIVDLWLSLGARCQRVHMRGLRAGDRVVDIELARERTGRSTQVRASVGVEGGSLAVSFAPHIPLLSRNARFEARAYEGGLDCDPRRSAGSLWAYDCDFEVKGRESVTLTYESGPELLLDDSPLVEGATSSRVRVCEVEHDDEKVEWTLWGLAGRTYRIGWRSDRKVEFQGATVIADELEITFPAGPEGTWTSAELRAVALD